MLEGAALWPILLGLTPWLALGVFVTWVVREPRPLPPLAPAAGGSTRDGPEVSIIVPARNEERSIGACVRSLARQRFPSFEIIVVDDRSDDDTARVAREAWEAAIVEGAAGADGHPSPGLTVLPGTDLPPGWLGKPWACATGARAARGTILLFVDADTVHDPELLARARTGLDEDGADALTLMGRQLMETFWERLVQPQVFLLLALRFAGMARDGSGPKRCRDAIANGQYIMIRRAVYEEIGGHESVRGEVVEDLALAQRICGAGRRLTIRAAEDAFATRMYHSLAELIGGWSKNFAVGARRASPRWVAPVVAPGTALTVFLLWVAPPLVLLWGVGAWALGGAGGGAPAATAGPFLAGAMAGPGSALLIWALAATLFSLLFWAAGSRRAGAPMRYAAGYPLGGAVVVWIALRSWVRGNTVEWKGRVYTVGEEWR